MSFTHYRNKLVENNMIYFRHDFFFLALGFCCFVFYNISKIVMAGLHITALLQNPLFTMSTAHHQYTKHALTRQIIDKKPTSLTQLLHYTPKIEPDLYLYLLLHLSALHFLFIYHPQPLLMFIGMQPKLQMF